VIAMNVSWWTAALLVGAIGSFVAAFVLRQYPERKPGLIASAIFERSCTSSASSAAPGW
jgi:hypothetical protein